MAFKYRVGQIIRRRPDIAKDLIGVIIDRQDPEARSPNYKVRIDSTERTEWWTEELTLPCSKLERVLK